MNHRDRYQQTQWTAEPQQTAESMTALHQENVDLAAEVAALKARLPTDEELAYLRNAKLERERSAWAWQQIRLYAPWVVAVTSAVSSAAYWIATHISIKGSGP